MKDFISRTGTAFYENRKLVIKFVLTLAYFAIVVYAFRILAYVELKSANRDMINIMVGAIVASFSLIVHFWFKRDDDDDNSRQGGSSSSS